MVTQIDTKCVNCGKRYGLHSANGSLCPKVSRGMVQYFRFSKQRFKKPLENKEVSHSASIDNTQPVICEKCGNNLSVDERTGGCVSNYCPWCGTRKKQAGA